MALTDGDGDPNAAPTTDDAPPRTVAEEAALLVDLLSQRGGWATGSGGASGSTGPAPGDVPRDTSDHSSASSRDAGTRECTCGGQTPQACRVCPVCQIISFVQKVNPETIERVADIALFAATALRDLATAQRERRDPGEGATDGATHDAAHGDAGTTTPDASQAQAGPDLPSDDGAEPADAPGRREGESS